MEVLDYLEPTASSSQWFHGSRKIVGEIEKVNDCLYVNIKLPCCICLALQLYYDYVSGVS